MKVGSLIIVGSVLLAGAAAGATHTWTGAVSTLWSDNGNWTGGTPAGDPSADLVFPPSSQLVSTNDIPGVTFVNSITFGGTGYTVNALPGSSIALAGDILNSAAGSNLISVPIALYGGVTHAVTAPDGADSDLHISGQLTGPSADALHLSVTGTFEVTLSGDNTYSGPTSVARRLGGTSRLIVLGSSPSSSVSVQTGGILSGTGTIGPLDAQSTVSPGAGNPGILTVAGSASFHDAGTLKVRLNGTNAGIQYDRLAVQGSVQLSPATSFLVVELGFVPDVGDTFTILQATGALSAEFSGKQDGQIFSVDCINFQIDYTSNSVVLTRVAGGGPPLSDVTIQETGSRTVCTNSTGGTVTVTDSGGCANTHQWGFRTSSGGAVTPIPGETGPTYTIDGSDFASPGTYYLVETTTPSFGSPLTSNELTITVVPPPTAVASGSATICPGASTPLSGSGAAMCSWTPATGLSDPNSCTPTASPDVTTTYSLVVSGPTGCTSTNSAQVTVTVDPSCVQGPSSYLTLPPCRAADTRDSDGTYGGPPLATGSVRVFPLAGRCGVPATAKAVALNVTVTDPTAPGFLTLYPSGRVQPLASSINYRTGQTRANNATAPLGADGGVAIYCGGSPGTVQVILDVSGYFE